ncbi:hypothetical protein B0H12DRAFT_1217214 [Mycena haematopus]|nr:hypothetical protein B0H12DRAFT_1217214 [Mycena haematopus]
MFCEFPTSTVRPSPLRSFGNRLAVGISRDRPGTWCAAYRNILSGVTEGVPHFVQPYGLRGGEIPMIGNVENFENKLCREVEVRHASELTSDVVGKQPTTPFLLSLPRETHEVHAVHVTLDLHSSSHGAPSSLKASSSCTKTQNIAGTAGSNGAVKKRATPENGGQDCSRAWSTDTGELPDAYLLSPSFRPTFNRLPASAGPLSWTTGTIPMFSYLFSSVPKPASTSCSTPGHLITSSFATRTSLAPLSPHFPVGRNFAVATKNDHTVFSAAQTTTVPPQTPSYWRSVTSARLQGAHQVQKPLMLSCDAPTCSVPAPLSSARRAELIPTSVSSPHATYSGMDVERGAPLDADVLSSRSFGARSGALPPESMRADVEAATWLLSSLSSRLRVNEPVLCDCTSGHNEYAVQPQDRPGYTGCRSSPSARSALVSSSCSADHPPAAPTAIASPASCSCPLSSPVPQPAASLCAQFAEAPTPSASAMPSDITFDCSTGLPSRLSSSHVAPKLPSNRCVPHVALIVRTAGASLRRRHRIFSAPAEYSSLVYSSCNGPRTLHIHALGICTPSVLLTVASSLFMPLPRPS